MNDVLRKQEELTQLMYRTYQEFPDTCLESMAAALAVARQAHAEEAIELIEIMRYEKARSIADFTSEFKARFLAQQETKTPEERVTVQRSATAPIHSRVFLDGIQQLSVCDPSGKHAERYVAGLRAELAGKETK